MGGFRLTNLAAGSASGDSVNVGQVPSLVASVPAHNTLCPHARLRIDWASNSTVTVAADQVVLANSAGVYRSFPSLSDTLNIAVTGANGRDILDNAGAEQASVWYHIWAIGQDGGTLDVFATQASFLGSATSIYTRLPAGYTWAGYLGAVRNNASSNFVSFNQRGDAVSADFQVAAVSGGASATYADLLIGQFVPQSAREALVDITATNTVVQTNSTAIVSSEGSGAAITAASIIATSVNTAFSGMQARNGGYLPLTTSQRLRYYTQANSAATVNVVGWRF